MSQVKYQVLTGLFLQVQYHQGTLTFTAGQLWKLLSCSFCHVLWAVNPHYTLSLLEELCSLPLHHLYTKNTGYCGDICSPVRAGFRNVRDGGKKENALVCKSNVCSGPSASQEKKESQKDFSYTQKGVLLRISPPNFKMLV